MRAQKILIVEDSILLHRMYQLILYPFTGSNGGMLHAYDAAQGFELLEKNADTTLIILDTTLPKVSGFDFLRQCKQNPAVRDIPVVVVSTQGKEENIQEGLQAGAYAYVTKPFQPTRLQELVWAIIQLREAHA